MRRGLPLVLVIALFAGVLPLAARVSPARAATPTLATITNYSTSTLKGPGSAQIRVPCPAGKRALGGGIVQSGSAGGLSVQASGPLDHTGTTLETNDDDVATQWYAAVWNRSGVARTFRVFAICSGASDATIEATQFSVGSAGSGEAFAVCPAGKRALGGGVVQSGAARSVVRASGPLNASGVTLETKDGDIATQWYAVVMNNTTVTRTFRVFAICE